MYNIYFTSCLVAKKICLYGIFLSNIFDNYTILPYIIDSPKHNPLQRMGHKMLNEEHIEEASQVLSFAEASCICSVTTATHSLLISLLKDPGQKFDNHVVWSVNHLLTIASKELAEAGDLHGSQELQSLIDRYEAVNPSNEIYF